MPLYTYKCPRCGEVVEKLVKSVDAVIFCECEADAHTPSGDIKQFHPEMQLVLSTPAAPQWNCRTAHSRSKGF